MTRELRAAATNNTMWQDYLEQGMRAITTALNELTPLVQKDLHISYRL